ncbi:MAG: UDP-N-acetylmuramoyl-L-alanyl-D-glutamate--2,6-diaminopimelate ligase [Deltaproteobacteria bacterium]|nr:UDP-N-acetylmuramoyl-L-alanyl-D-glutamate--2,6-diaminopimelate ligase [Deltaproteobacteria bacterium]
MRIRDFLAVDTIEESHGDLEQEVSGLTYDSRQAGPGRVFFAMAGVKADGHDFVKEVFARGAAAVVVERSDVCPAGATWVRVASTRRALALWSARFYSHPTAELPLVGVTGTNGKTTVTYLVEAILRAAGLEPGVIGTVNYRYCGRELPSHHTTPEALDLQALLVEMRRGGATAVAMEVSSHALAQDRVRGLEFDVAVFTNLSRDHLDYHRDMDDYFLAKSKLFTDHLQHSRKAKKAAVIYGADPRGQDLLATVRGLGLESWSYGVEKPWDVHAVDVQSDVSGLRGKIAVKDRRFDFASPLVGAANLQNILGAVAVGFALRLPEEKIFAGVGDLKRVPGRLEKVEQSLGISILVDYAHTPDALEKVLGAVRPLTRGKVITVFGCGGDRDRGKRPLMGEIAGRLSDVAVLTSDNPRTEEPLAILDEVEAGIRKTAMKKFRISGSEFRVEHQTNDPAKPETRNPKPETISGYCVEADRRAAIGIALELALPGDVVLIAGKGHEDYQILGTTKIHFDDREVAREEAGRRAGA